MSNVVVGNGGFCGFLSELKVFQRGGRKQPKLVYVLLPIMPIGIVAYAFTLS